MIKIIGASGFVGTRLLDLLLDQKKEVQNIDKNPSPFHNEITTISDVRNTEELKVQLFGAEHVVLLAAEHRDDVSPSSLYYDVNVQGMKNVLEAMDKNGVRKIIFTSSVAVYGLNKENPDEQYPTDPFNHYGKSKLQAEQVLKDWYQKDPEKRQVQILRPTVIFGERNRGNVYNLLKQIASGSFMMIGKGRNQKSMAYVGNIVAFINHLLDTEKACFEVYNYVDNPDLSMNDLTSIVSKKTGKKISSLKIPFAIGMIGGFGFDVLSIITRKKFTISLIRVRKFCATTQFNSAKAYSEFNPPYTLSEGIERTLYFEFIKNDEEKDDIVFVTE
jgi:nucleoside-diphosphate-sugar epimerase